MSGNLFSRYVWIVDTIRRHGSITRRQLNEKWKNSPYSNGGQPLTRRTFYNYRNAIAELFQVNIECDPVTYEYSIESAGVNNESITNWLLNSATMSDVLAGSRDIASRIYVEEVPSARTYLAAMIDAIKGNHPVRMAYHPYTRSKPTPDIMLEPYFLKIFRQRWYVTGMNVKDRKLKTYALDRIADLSIDSGSTFEMPADFDPEEYFRYSYGIIFDEGEPKRVQLKVDPRQAKYMRALPLHHSQSESIHDAYSIFTYNLKLTPDFIQELLSMGPKVTVINPPELRAIITASLRDTLANYAE
ncbi:MAG: WYL domain-containing protein [Bacteroides sp.]|nr:WYL domain-containing protein [Bacteroides sp.]